MQMLHAFEKFRAKKYNIELQNAARDIAPAMRTHRLRENFWDGVPHALLPICAPTHGAGNPKIHRLRLRGSEG